LNPTGAEIIDSTAWKEMVARMKDGIRTEWEATNPKDADALQDLSYRQRAMRDVIFAFERGLKSSLNLQK